MQFGATMYALNVKICVKIVVNNLYKYIMKGWESQYKKCR